MKSDICKCGESQCKLEKYADSYVAVCSGCGEVIPTEPKDKSAVLFYIFIYTHNRNSIRRKFADDAELLKEALRAKDVQEEEAYKRKIKGSKEYES